MTNTNADQLILTGVAIFWLLVLLDMIRRA